jgi:lysophospholipase L1-like esterase
MSSRRRLRSVDAVVSTQEATMTGLLLHCSIRSRSAVLLAAAAALALTLTAAAAGRTEAVEYYVSLGDSFAVGAQPTGEPPFFETDEGYADRLHRVLALRRPGLRLVKLGCGGETTRSMRVGSVDPAEGSSCGPPDFYRHRYPHKTQLAEALVFLHAHKRHVALVTLDVGGNDVLHGGGVEQIQANLPVILRLLRRAAGPGVPIVGMDYYDPGLPSAWFGSLDVQAVAAEASNLAAFDDVLKRDYAAAGDPVADVETTFSSLDTSVQPDGLPLDVERVCEWTWICSAGDLHPNETGYGVIAQAFERVVAPLMEERR